MHTFAQKEKENAVQGSSGAAYQNKFAQDFQRAARRMNVRCNKKSGVPAALSLLRKESNFPARENSPLTSEQQEKRERAAVCQ